MVITAVFFSIFELTVLILTETFAHRGKQTCVLDYRNAGCQAWTSSMKESLVTNYLKDILRCFPKVHNAKKNFFLNSSLMVISSQRFIGILCYLQNITKQLKDFNYHL